MKGNPTSQDRAHWEHEIETAKKNIRNELDRMGPKARQETENYLKGRGIDLSE